MSINRRLSKAMTYSAVVVGSLVLSSGSSAFADTLVNKQEMLAAKPLQFVSRIKQQPGQQLLQFSFDRIMDSSWSKRPFARQQVNLTRDTGENLVSNKPGKLRKEDKLILYSFAQSMQ